jgi:hypothetical protein
VLIGERGHVDIVVRWDNRTDELDPLVYPRAAIFGQIVAPLLAPPKPGALGTGYYPGIFGNYVRLYLPPDAQDVRIQGTSYSPRLIPGEEFTLVGGLIAIPSGASGQVIVSYRLPGPPATVQVWKQGGIEHDVVRILQNVQGAQETLFAGPFTADVTVPLADPQPQPLP